MADMRWWEGLSRRFGVKPIEAQICAACAYWTPVEGVAVFARCQNPASKNHGENTPGDWGCEQYLKTSEPIYADDEKTPVEIPEWLHRKRTEGDHQD